MRKGKLNISLTTYAVVAFVLALLGQLLLCGLLLAFVLVHEKDEWASRQCMQAFFLSLATGLVGFGAAASLLLSQATYGFGRSFFGLVTVLLGLVSIVLLVFDITGLVKVAKGKEANVPIVSSLADRTFGRVNQNNYAQQTYYPSAGQPPYPGNAQPYAPGPAPQPPYPSAYQPPMTPPAYQAPPPPPPMPGYAPQFEPQAATPPGPEPYEPGQAYEQQGAPGGYGADVASHAASVASMASSGDAETTPPVQSEPLALQEDPLVPSMGNDFQAEYTTAVAEPKLETPAEADSTAVTEPESDGPPQEPVNPTGPDDKPVQNS